MRIGIDFDGVIADTTSLMLRYAREQMGLELEPHHIVPPHGPERLGEQLYLEWIWSTHRTPLALEAEVLPAVEGGLQRLAARHELWLVTAREPESMALAEQWLKVRGLLDWFSGLRSSNRGAKRDVAVELALGAMIDDSPPHLVGLPEHVRPILMTAPHNVIHRVEPPLVRASGWDHHEVFDAL